jgi:endogenous inhibitor of DNA gyrase (YacG/DUF329 family)
MIDEGPGEHDRHLMDDAEGDTVACARCGRMVWAQAQRCPHCGVHFAGEAWEFRPAGARRWGGLPRWAVVTGLVLAAILILLAVLCGW